MHRMRRDGVVGREFLDRLAGAGAVEGLVVGVGSSPRSRGQKYYQNVHHPGHRPGSGAEATDLLGG